MNTKTEKRFTVCSAAFGAVFTALMFESLFKWKPLGINVFLMVVCVYASLLFAQKGKLDLKREKNYLLFIPIAFLSAAFAFFNNGLILFLDAVMLIALMSCHISLMSGRCFKNTFGRNFVRTVGRQTFYTPFSRIGKHYRSVFSGDVGRKKLVGGILIGIAVCIPLIIILLLLLTSADMIFEKMVTDIISWETVRDIFLALIMFAAVFTVTGSVLIFTSETEPESEEHTKKPRPRFSIPAVFIITVLASAVLIIFGVVQVLYLAKIKFMPYGFSYSEYARQGFFQLCGAAALVFIVLAVSMSFTVHAKKGAKLALNIVFTVLALSVLMLLVSAFMRMVLYEQEYLFSRLRLYTQAFMILLAVITVFVIIKIWKREIKLFKPVFWSVIIGMIALTYFNADAFIAKTAVSNEIKTGKPADYEYLLSLSKDALPFYADRLTEDMFVEKYIYDEQDEYYEYGMHEDYVRLAKNIDYKDIRGFNISRIAAYDALDKDLYNLLTDKYYDVTAINNRDRYYTEDELKELISENGDEFKEISLIFTKVKGVQFAGGIYDQDRFSKEDWEKIVSFMQKNGVREIIEQEEIIHYEDLKQVREKRITFRFRSSENDENCEISYDVSKNEWIINGHLL